jgi:hypothetical protein
MSITAGQFSETALLQARYYADQLLLDGRIKQQFIPKITAFNYLQNLQTARLNQAFASKSKKDFDVEIMWENVCSDLSIPDVSCEIGGPEASTNAHTYTLYKRIVKGFTVDDDKFRDNEYDSNIIIAKLILQAEKQIAEEFTQYCIAQLNFFAGVNQVTNGKGFVNPADNTITDIDPANWTAEIMAYFARVMQLNRFSNAAMITGSNLYETLYVAAAMAANAEGKGDYILWNKMPIWFDLFNVDTVNNPELYTYMVEQGSIAMASKAFNPDAVTRTFHDERYTMPSRFLPGMTYDVFYTNECKTDGTYKDVLKHHWKIVLTADIFKNPYGCDAIEDGGQIGGLNSGILRFRNEVPTIVPTPTPTPTPTP